MVESRPTLRPKLGRDRQTAFDGMRFVCALLVMVSHSPDLMGFKLALPHTMLTVETFFVISGYLLNNRYGAKFADGAPPSQLAFARLMRILPVAYLGLVMGVAASLLTHGPGEILRTGLELGIGLLMLPWPSRSGHNFVAPLDFPFWTLIWEVWMNMLLLFGWSRIRGPLLAGLLMATGAAVILAACDHGNLDIGVQAPHTAAGAARAGFAFFLGVALARTIGRRWAAPRAPAWLVICVMVALFAIPVPQRWNWIYEVCAAMVLLPVVVWFGASAGLSGWGLGAAALASRLFYGVYAFHAPMVRFAVWICNEIGAPRSGWLMVPTAICVLALAYVTSRTYEPWVRNRIGPRWAQITCRGASAAGATPSAPQGAPWVRGPGSVRAQSKPDPSAGP